MSIQKDFNKTVLKGFKEEVLEEYQRATETDSAIDYGTPEYEILSKIETSFKNFCSVSLYEKPLPITEFAKGEGDLILSEIGKLENILLASAIVETIKNYNISIPIAIAEWAQGIEFDPAIKDRFKAAKISLNSYLKNHYKDENQNDKWEEYIKPELLKRFKNLEQAVFKNEKSQIRIAAFLVHLWRKGYFTDKVVHKKGSRHPTKSLNDFSVLKYHKQIKDQLALTKDKELQDHIQRVKNICEKT